MQFYQSRFSSQVRHFERDVAKAKQGVQQNLIYGKITGLTSDLDVQQQPEVLEITTGKEEEGSDAQTSGSEDEDSQDNENDDDASRFKNSARPREESPESKKARKKAVKDAKAEQRKVKVKKHVKKRKEKMGSMKK